MDWRDVWKKHGGSWFDLVACCYCVIYESGNERPVFSAQVEASVSKPGSPVDRLIRSVCEIVPSRGLGRRCADKAIETISCLYDDAVSDPDWPKKYAEDIGCWAIVVGVDKCVVDSGASDMASVVGPLNTALRDKVGVYYKPSSALVGDVLSVYGVRFSPMEQLSERLQGLNVVARVAGQPLPLIQRPDGSVARFGHGEGTQSDDSAAPSLKMRIGIAACSCDLSIDPASQDIRTVGADGEGLFGVEYASAYDDRYEELLGAPLSKAIDAGCDCVVFPEMVVSSGHLNRMKDQLRATKDTKSLQLVVAGSVWDRRDESGAGSNTCYFLDRFGNVLGATTKKNPYVNNDVEPHQIEHLDSGVNETTLLDVEGLGRLMVAICKDLESDTNYAFQMASVFRPDMLCVPAASGSVKGAFVGQADAIARRLHTICCVSNLCSMVKQWEDDYSAGISFVAVPSVKIGESHGRQPEVGMVFCRRAALGNVRDRSTPDGAGNRSASGDMGGCACSNGGCLFVVDVNYDAAQASGVIPEMAVGDSPCACEG